MSESKISVIKNKLAQGQGEISRDEAKWLVQRVEELEKENEWLRKELSYLENQGEVGF